MKIQRCSGLLRIVEKNKEWRMNREKKRLEEKSEQVVIPWRKWGPYVSERAWGTVREDYSENGDPWVYFPHHLAVSKAYRWGEDAIAGWCDRYQVLVFAPVFWNGKDAILKERLFGLSSPEGNHGEDVKESYFYLDGTPTHSYMKFLYKYPQQAFPYDKLREENAKRGTNLPEYELIDTGIFSENRYFDIFIEYAKADPDDICIKIEAFNRGPEAAPLHLLSQLLFRNQWAWGDQRQPEPTIKSEKGNCLIADDSQMNSPAGLSFDYHLGRRYLYGFDAGAALFTDNETGKKDAFHRKIVKGEQIEEREKGTKAALYYRFDAIQPGKSITLLFRLTDKPHLEPLEEIELIIEKRKAEADEFYEEIHPKGATHEEKRIQRQALGGILWSKQIYLFDVNLWLKGDNTFCLPPQSRYHIRNVHWRHLNSMRILSMPDKWEYPYFCAWDHAFHCVTLSLVDMELAKEQLWLLLFDQFQHPNGQIPACEWEFSDLNPPVQSWALLRLYNAEKEKTGRADRNFLAKCYHKLLINFAWWVNKVDSEGNNVFEGGFLGLDNITVVDRSRKLLGGGKLQQSDGTGWMAMFCLNLMRIALELAKEEPVYESLAIKFFEHYIYIGYAIKKRGDRQYSMWSDEDGFFYDVLAYPDGNFKKFRLRSLVGIIPLYAVDEIEEEELDRFPEFRQNFHWFMTHRQDLVEHCVFSFESQGKKRRLLTVMNEHQLRRVLEYVWNPSEFRSDFGLRSLSKFHEGHPFIHEGSLVGYEPAESLERIKGGNSNWRGPIWFPTTFLLIDSLKRLGDAFGKSLIISLPGENPVDLKTMADSFAKRLLAIFLKDNQGRRPYLGEQFPFHNDPHWRDYFLFYEYFNPETGAGLGAAHQTGWTALIANLISECQR
jgi:hypothetical protein